MGGFVVVVVVEFSGDDAVDDLVEQNRDGMEQQIGVVVMVVEVTDDVDDDGRPIFRALHASPDSNPLQSMPVMRYYELDYVSPFITSQFDPTSVNTVRDLQSARHPHPADDFSDPDSEFSLSSE